MFVGERVNEDREDIFSYMRVFVGHGKGMVPFDGVKRRTWGAWVLMLRRVGGWRFAAVTRCERLQVIYRSQPSHFGS